MFESLGKVSELGYREEKILDFGEKDIPEKLSATRRKPTFYFL